MGRDSGVTRPAGEGPPASDRAALAEEAAEGLKIVDMVADDFDDTECGDGEDHSGNTPDQIAGKKYDNGEQGVDVDLGLHDEGGDDIELDALDQDIDSDHREYHMETAALGQGHQAGKGSAGDIADEGDDLEDAAEDRKKYGIMDTDRGKSDAIHDPEADDYNGKTPEVLLHHLHRLDDDDLGLSFGYSGGGPHEEGSDVVAEAEQHDHIDEDKQQVDGDGNDDSHEGGSHPADTVAVGL